jgi:uridine kinase
VTGSTKPSNGLPFLLGVAGGSGSGKTYFAQAVRERIGEDLCEIVYQDNFYLDQSKRFDYDGGSVNFDHPSSIDFDLLAERLAQLRAGLPVDIPIYDFVTHSRKPAILKIRPKAVIIVDGILIFHSAPVRSLFHDLIFFETPETVRYQRRLERDVKERGRTPEGVKSQFEKQVKPMHDQFVEPSKIFARTTVRSDSEYHAALDVICNRFTI